MAGGQPGVTGQHGRGTIRAELGLQHKRFGVAREVERQCRGNDPGEIVGRKPGGQRQAGRGNQAFGTTELAQGGAADAHDFVGQQRVGEALEHLSDVGGVLGEIEPVMRNQAGAGFTQGAGGAGGPVVWRGLEDDGAAQRNAG